MKQKKEAQARIKINNLLEDAEWRFFDSDKGAANVFLEENIRFTDEILDELGGDFQNVPRGAIDYLLVDDRGFPICVLEAKRESIHPLEAKEQARRYATQENARFIILSNGNSHYLWDTRGGNPEMITEFPTQESLIHRATYVPNIKELIAAQIDEQYLAPAKTLRKYQVEAIQSIQAAAKNGKRRYLFEMATGTGKTTTAGAVCKLFLSTGNAKRILFLVDRIELETQAVEALGWSKGIFKDSYFVNTIKSGDWRKCQIVVSTIQTLMIGDRYKKMFSPTDFELVISDEAHRSIGGNSRAVFEYFIGYKLGLTATPKDYIKGLDEKKESQDPSAIELRQLRDTYRTFGCETGEPTFRYDLKKGVEEKYLINPYPIDARTEVTTELLAEEGYVVDVQTNEGGSQEESYGVRDFEKKFFNEDTNRVFAQTILNNWLLDPITGEFGKTLIFCVSQSHAAKITNLLNQFGTEKWPQKYDSNFAMQVTSNVVGAQDCAKAFTDNILNGKSKYAESTHPDYDTCRTRICVTVGMMTTGYDCPDLLNVALLRPIFSPSDFIQMKGRGTRPHTFYYAETGEKKQKEKFILFDFFGNCEFFEKEFDYAKKLDLPKTFSAREKPIIDPPPRSWTDINQSDKILTETVIHIGPEWMRIDRELYKKTKHEQFEFVLQRSERVKGAFALGGVAGVEKLLNDEVFNRPTEFWRPESIRESYEKEWNTQRKVSLSEIIAKALGLIKRFSTRDERLESEWQKFLATEQPIASDDDLSKTNQQTEALKDIFEAYISDPQFRKIIGKWTFADLESYPLIGMNEIEIAWIENLERVSEYAESYLLQEMKEFNFVA